MNSSENNFVNNLRWATSCRHFLFGPCMRRLMMNEFGQGGKTAQECVGEVLGVLKWFLDYKCHQT